MARGALTSARGALTSAAMTRRIGDTTPGVSVSAQRRLQTRHPVELSATLELAGEKREGILRNLSLGGAFLAVELPEPPPTTGARAYIHFRIPTHEATISVGASIRWSSDEGVGLQFDGLRAGEVWSLNKYFEQQRS